MINLFYHYGMHTVLPIGAKIPRVRKKVTVRFGPATTISQQWLTDNYGENNPDLWALLRDWSKEQLLDLEAKTRPESS